MLVLIGSIANLSFLGEVADKLGLTPGVEISRSNPVDIDVFSHQCTALPGLFAMGPLIGDNFVRLVSELQKRQFNQWSKIEELVIIKWFFWSIKPQFKGPKVAIWYILSQPWIDFLKNGIPSKYI